MELSIKVLNVITQEHVLLIASVLVDLEIPTDKA